MPHSHREQARDGCVAGGFCFEGVHIRFCGNGGLGFRPYGGSLGRAPSNQGLLPLTFGLSTGQEDQKPKRGGLTADLTTTERRSPVGASLLAKNAGTPRGFRQPALSLTSIASKLAPTEEQKQSKNRAAYTHALHHSTGQALARLPLLIHPPPRQAEWRCSSGDWRAAPFDAVEHIAGRCSEANRRAMPPDECRSEGTPSLSEGPYVRGERFFAYFF